MVPQAKTAPKAATTAPQQAAKQEPSPAPAGEWQLCACVKLVHAPACMHMRRSYLAATTASPYQSRFMIAAPWWHLIPAAAMLPAAMQLTMQTGPMCWSHTEPECYVCPFFACMQVHACTGYARCLAFLTRPPLLLLQPGVGPIDVAEEQQILGLELGAVDAQARVEELVASNAELRRQIEATRAHAEELAAIKESLAKEVRRSNSSSSGPMHRSISCTVGC